jgi:hypothetical protein
MDLADRFTAGSSTEPYDSVKVMDCGEQGPGKKQRMQSNCQRDETGNSRSSPWGVETVRNGSLTSMEAPSASHSTLDADQRESSTKQDATRWWFSHSAEQPGMVLCDHLGCASEAIESLSYNSSNWSLSRLHSPQEKGSEKIHQKLCKQAQSRVRRALLTGN